MSDTRTVLPLDRPTPTHDQGCPPRTGQVDPDDPADRGTVIAEIDGPLATVTMSRPRKRNALTVAMWADIGELVERFADTDGVRLIVLRGDGGCFSAGADLQDVLAATADLDAALRYCRTLVGTLAAVAGCRIPTLAAVDGVASGGGVELALAADNRIATPRSTFQLPFGALGVVPDALTLRRLTTTVGEATAQWMMLTGRPVGAAAALRTGLIDDLVDDQNDNVGYRGDNATNDDPDGGTKSPRLPLDTAAAEIARAAAQASFPALLRARELVKPRVDADQIERDAEQMAQSFVSGPVREAAHRFTSKRPSSTPPEHSHQPSRQDLRKRTEPHTYGHAEN